MNETSVRAMVSETRRPEDHPGDARAGATDRRTRGNDIRRCILLLSHLLNHSDPDALQEQLLPELFWVSGELKSWQTRREAMHE